jgi:hypothetical protein
MKNLNLRKTGGNPQFSTKKKEAKKKGEPPCGKVENAMRPRFPLSHRACYQRPKETTRERTRTEKEGGLPAAIIDQNRRPPPQFLVVATPQF